MKDKDYERIVDKIDRMLIDENLSYIEISAAIELLKQQIVYAYEEDLK